MASIRIASRNEGDYGWHLDYTAERSGKDMKYKVTCYWFTNAYTRGHYTAKVTIGGVSVSKSIAMDSYGGYHEQTDTVGTITVKAHGAQDGSTKLPGTWSFDNRSGGFNAPVEPGGAPSFYIFDGEWKEADDINEYTNEWSSTDSLSMYDGSWKES